MTTPPSLEELEDRYDATPRETLASLVQAGSPPHQFTSTNDRARRDTDRHQEARAFSSLLDLLADSETISSPIVSCSLRLVVMGISGSGKSSTANTLLRRPAFHISASSEADLQGTTLHSAEVEGRLLEVVDTAGPWRVPKDVFNSNDNEIFVLVINLAAPRFEERQFQRIRQLKDSRNRNLLRNHLCLLLLTHADTALEQTNLREYVHAARGQPLEQLISEDLQGWRVLAISNACQTEYERRVQNEALERLIRAVTQAATRAPPAVKHRCRRAALALLLGTALITVVILLIYYLLIK